MDVLTGDPEWCDTRLYTAAYEGNFELIETLLKNEPQLKQCINMGIRPLGSTPLRLAAIEGHADVVKLLLSHGAEVDKPDVKNQTPLFVAINHHRYNCCQVLLSAFANPNGDEGNLSSPLYIATQKGFLDEVMLLLKYGADPEPYRRNYYNYTGGSYPLQASVVYCSPECFKTLLAAGAEPDPRKLKLPVPDMVVTQLSLIHSIVRYHPLDARLYARLFTLFGGYLWQRNTANQLATDLDMPIGERMDIHELMGNPLKLCELCRISVRREVGRKRLHLVNTLPLPQRVINFLLCKDIIDERLLIHK